LSEGRKSGALAISSLICRRRIVVTVIWREAHGALDSTQEEVEEWSVLRRVWQTVFSMNKTNSCEVYLDGLEADLMSKVGCKETWVVSMAGKLCHFMEAQKVEYLRMPAWYKRRVESVIVWDWR